MQHYKNNFRFLGALFLVMATMQLARNIFATYFEYLESTFDRKELSTVSSLSEFLNITDNSQVRLRQSRGTLQTSHSLIRGWSTFEISAPPNEINVWNDAKSRKYSSSVECIGPEQNRSCQYKNLYFEEGKWYLFLVGKNAAVGFEYGNIVHGYYCFFNQRHNRGINAPVIPAVRNFDSEEAIYEYIASKQRLSTFPGLTVMIGDPYVKNIGHALFDGLYPVFLSLIRFKRHLQKFNIVFHPLKSTNDLYHAAIFRRFSGGSIYWLPKMHEISIFNGSLFLFEEYIMGSGGMCQRCVNPRYELPGGYELDGTRLFRDRMYLYFNLLPPAYRPSSMARRSAHDPLRGIVVANKRFTPAHLAAIHDVIRRVGNAAALNLRLELISYKDFPGENRYGNVSLLSRDHLSFEAHLRILSRSDMYVSGPGTALMYLPFMPDGAVNVALGAAGKINAWHGDGAGFMEQYLAAGCPYLRTVMYPIRRLREGLDADVLFGLVAQAAALIRSDFPMPVDQDAASSLAPDGRLFREMCARDAGFCRAATDRAGGWDECNSFWVEEFVAEQGHWAPGQKCSGRYNHSLLSELKVKYGLS